MEKGNRKNQKLKYIKSYLKNHFFLFLFCMSILIIIISVIFLSPTHSVSSFDYSDINVQRQALLEALEAYYRVNVAGGNYSKEISNVQYDTARKYLYATPEDVASDHTVFTDCSGYAFQAFKYVFNVNLPSYTTLQYANKRAEEEGSTTVTFTKGVEKSKDGKSNILFNMSVSNNNGTELYNNLKKLMDKNSGFVWQTGDILAVEYQNGSKHIMVVDMGPDGKGVSFTNYEVTYINAHNGNYPMVNNTTFVGGYYDVNNYFDKVERQTIGGGRNRTGYYITGDSSLFIKHFPSGCFTSSDESCKTTLNGNYTTGRNGNAAYKQVSIIRYITDEGKMHLIQNDNYNAGTSTVSYTMTSAGKFRLKYPQINITKSQVIESGAARVDGGINSLTPGDKITYTVKIENKSSVNYSNLTLKETIDSKLKILSVKSGCTNSSNVVTCSNISINSGKYVELTFTVQVPYDNSLIKSNVENTGYLQDASDTTLKVNTRRMYYTILPAFTKFDEEKILNAAKSASGTDITYINNIYKAANISNQYFEYPSMANLANLISTSKGSNVYTPSGTLASGCSTKGACYLSQIGFVESSSIAGSANVRKSVLLNYYGAKLDTFSYVNGNPNYPSKINIYEAWNWFSNDENERARDIKVEDFQIGDVIIDVNNDSSRKAYIFLGKKSDGSYNFARSSSNQSDLSAYSAVDVSGKQYWTNELSNLIGKEYMILRPSRLYSKNYNGGNIKTFTTSNNNNYTTTRDVTLNLTWGFTDNVANPGIYYCITTQNSSASCEGKWVNVTGLSANPSYTIPSSVTSGQTHKIYAFVMRASSGVITESKELSITLDTTAPTISVTPSLTGSGTWYRGGKQTFSVSDGTGSGVATVKSCTTSGTTCDPGTSESVKSSYEYTLSNGQNQVVCLKATDNAGNESAVKCSTAVNIDSVLPSLSIGSQIETNNGSTNNWYKDGKIEVTLSDELSGPKEIKTCTTTGTDCEPSTTVAGGSTKVTLKEGANSYICASGSDNAGNTAARKCSTKYNIDGTVPTLSSFEVNGGNHKITSATTSITLAFSDATSGVKEYCISTTNSASSCVSGGLVNWKEIANEASHTTTTLNANLALGSDGAKNLYAFVKDAAGNVSSSRNVNVTLDTKAPTISDVVRKSATDKTITVEVTASDENGIDQYCYGINGRTGNYECTNDKTHTFSNLNENIEYRIFVYAIDNFGNGSQSDAQEYNFMTEKGEEAGPDTTGVINSFRLNGNNDIVINRLVSLSLSWSYNDGASNVQSECCISTTNSSEGCNWTIVNGGTSQSNISYTIPESVNEGQVILYAFVRRSSTGYITKSSMVQFTLDTTAPTVSITNTQNTTSWYKSGTMSVVVNDATSGIKEIRYCESTNGVNCDPSTSSNVTNLEDYPKNKTIGGIVLSEGSAVKICAKATDKGGLSSGVQCSDAVKIDRSNPTISLKEEMPSASSSWYQGGSVKVTISDTLSGRKEIKYCTTTSAECTPEKVSSEEVTTIDFISGKNSKVCVIGIDNADNSSEETCTNTYNIDKDRPTLSAFTIANGAEWTKESTVDVHLGYSDPLSGVHNYCLTTENNAGTCSWKEVTNNSSTDIKVDLGSDGTKTYYAFVKDSAGNISSELTDSIKLDTTVPVITDIKKIGDNEKSIKVEVSVTEENVKNYCYTLNTSKTPICERDNTYTFEGLKGGTDYKIKVYVTDEAGNKSLEEERTFRTKEVEVPTPNEGGEITDFSLTNGAQEFIKERTINVSLSWQYKEASDTSEYCINTSETTSGCTWNQVSGTSANVQYTFKEDITEGAVVLYAYVRKGDGSSLLDPKELELAVDYQAPVLDISIDDLVGSSPWYRGANANIRVTDGLSGIKEIKTCIGISCTPVDVTTVEGYPKIETITKEISEGSGIKVCATSSDKAGWVSEVKCSIPINVDKEKPNIEVGEIENATKGENGWYKDGKIKLNISDELSGINYINYCLSNSTGSNRCDPSSLKYTFNDDEKTIEVQIPLNDGKNSGICVKGYDKALNTTEVICSPSTYNIDGILPIITEFKINNGAIWSKNSDLNIQIKHSDNVSGVTNYCVKEDNDISGCVWRVADKNVTSGTYKVSDGNKVLYVFVKDEAGNVSKSAQGSIKVDTVKPVIKNVEKISDSENRIVVKVDVEEENIASFCYALNDNNVPTCIRNNNYTFEDLKAGTNYKINVYCLDEAGNISETMTKEYKTKEKETPTIPDIPDNPSTPDTPDNPNEPSNPTTPSNPSTPDNQQPNSGTIKPDSGSDKPNNPTTPSTPSEPTPDENLKPVIKDFKIEEGINEGYTNSKSVKVTLNWDDTTVREYCIQTDKDNSKCNWKSAPASGKVEEEIDLGSDGEKTIYAYLKNTSSIISESVKETITLDTKMPEISKIEKIDNETTKLTVKVSASEEGTYCYLIDDGVPKCSKNDTYTFTNLQPGTTHNVKVYVTDKAGNKTEIKEIEFTTSNTTTVNTIPEKKSNNTLRLILFIGIPILILLIIIILVKRKKQKENY